MIGSLRTIEAKDLDAMSSFLLQAHQRSSAPNFDPQMLNWKYLHPRWEWSGSRGFLLEKDRRIIACGGVLPAVFQLPNGDMIKSSTLIDWAADPSVPAVGVMLMRKVLEKARTMFIIGGTPSARRLLPKIGFRSAGDVTTYAQWVRPLQEFRSRPKTMRSVLRLGHAAAHSIHFRSKSVKDWDSLRVNHFDESLQTLLNKRSAQMAFCQRRVESLNYMLKCPSVEMKGFLLRRNRAIVGYFILGKMGWQGRLVDIFVDVDSAEPGVWELAYATATQAIANDSEICRIFAWATMPLLREALLKNGFWLQDKKPITVWDPSKLLADSFPVDLQLIDGEGAFLVEPKGSRAQRNSHRL